MPEGRGTEIGMMPEGRCAKIGALPKDRATEIGSKMGKSTVSKVSVITELELAEIDVFVLRFPKVDAFKGNFDLRVCLPPAIPNILPASRQRKEEFLIDSPILPDPWGRQLI
jgi:hypothetical protein